MICSCRDKVKRTEIFTKEYGDLINEIEMYKHHLDKGRKILCSPYQYGKIMWKLIAHKSTARTYQLNFYNAFDSDNSEEQLLYNIFFS